MKIAVTYEDGKVFQHFGHTENFKIYEVENNEIKASKVINSNGEGHGALSKLLSNNQIDALICGGIGGGARMALDEAGIALYPGVEGSADEAVKSFLEGELNYNPDTVCNHHHHEGEGHSCGSHKCGENHHGCHGN